MHGVLAEAFLRGGRLVAAGAGAVDGPDAHRLVEAPCARRAPSGVARVGCCWCCHRSGIGVKKLPPEASRLPLLLYSMQYTAPECPSRSCWKLKIRRSSSLLDAVHKISTKRGGADYWEIGTVWSGHILRPGARQSLVLYQVL